MKSIKESCVDFFKNEDIRKDIKEIIRPIGMMIYNEIYLYIWLVCFYNVFLILIILANLFILFRLMKKSNQFSIIND
jgi:hypothetical protein